MNVKNFINNLDKSFLEISEKDIIPLSENINNLEELYSNIKKNINKDCENKYLKIKSLINKTIKYLFSKNKNNEYQLAVDYILNIFYKSELTFSLFILDFYNNELDDDIIMICCYIEFSHILINISMDSKSLLNNQSYNNLNKDSSLHIVFGETISYIVISSLNAIINSKLLEIINKKKKEIEIKNISMLIDISLNHNVYKSIDLLFDNFTEANKKIYIQKFKIINNFCLNSIFISLLLYTKNNENIYIEDIKKINIFYINILYYLNEFKLKKNIKIKHYIIYFISESFALLRKCNINFDLITYKYISFIKELNI